MDRAALSARLRAELPAQAPLRLLDPPCFFSRVCTRRAAMEKAGRSVCRDCAQRLRGFEYPLRRPSLQPLYDSARSLTEQLDMTEGE